VKTAAKKCLTYHGRSTGAASFDLTGRGGRLPTQLCLRSSSHRGRSQNKKDHPCEVSSYENGTDQRGVCEADENPPLNGEM
jgi:hypothetical protein